MKKKFLLIATLFIFGRKCYSQSQIITTGNNIIDTTNPVGADIVIGSYNNGGTRHDSSIMWWSNASASRISNTYDVFYFSVWNTTNANIGLNAGVGGTSYFQGNLLIGKTTQTNASYLLDVAGNVRANAVTVNTTGADFVFEPSYKLLALPTLKEYIDKNHHLPEIASAKEMRTDGLNVGENQVKLLQKVEELTLYLIDKDKQLDIQSKQLKSQQNQLNQLKRQLNKILNQHKN